MKASAVLILAGYGALIWQFGWWGVALGVAHVGVLLLFVKK